MGINVIGSITVNVKIEGEDENTYEYEEQEILGSEFHIEEDGRRNLGDGDFQYEALFMYFGEEFTISFQAANFNGHVSRSEVSIEGDATLVSDDLDVMPTVSDEEEEY